jgi:xanthine dehydrogenase molybdopterin-binding subunit B
LLTGGALAGPASAAPPQQDGLVNVNVGDVEILNDVNIGVAAQVAANICGVSVKNVAVLARITDRSGDTTTVCETAQGPVQFVQN